MGRSRPRPLLWAGLAAGVFVLLLASVGQFRQATSRHEIGWGYEGPRWLEDPILQIIGSDQRSIAGKPLASNAPDLIGLMTHRRSAHVPKWFSRPRGRPYGKMPDQIRQFGRWAMTNDARIVYFRKLDNRYDFLSDESRLMEQLHLKPLVEKPEGRIYAVIAIKGFEDEDYDDDGEPDWTNLEEPLRSEVKAQLDAIAKESLNSDD